MMLSSESQPPTSVETGSAAKLGDPQPAPLSTHSSLDAALPGHLFGRDPSLGGNHISESLPNPNSFNSLSAPPKPASEGAGSGWTSLEGLPRPPSGTWQTSPSDGILQSTHPFLSTQGMMGSHQQVPPPPRPNVIQGLPQGLDAATLARLQSGLQQQINGGQARAPLPMQPQAGGGLGALAGLTPVQQQLLQQHILQQQAQQQQQQQAQKAAALHQAQNGFNGGGLNGMNNTQAVAQAAALRQQQAAAALLRQQQAQAQAQAQQQQQQAAQQQASHNSLLLQQALLAQGAASLGGGGQHGMSLQQQQQINAQLQSMAMRQGGLSQATINALLGAGPNAGGVNNTHGQAPPSAPTPSPQGPGITPQQQMLLQQLRGMNANGMQGGPPQQQQQQQGPLRSNSMGSMGGVNGMGNMQQQHRPLAGQQLQSEALIAMQRQAATAGMGGRPPAPQQLGTGGFSPDQLTMMAQLGLLSNKPAAPPPGLTAQQQTALLNALQSGGMGRGGGPQQSQQQQYAQQQQQQRGPPPQQQYQGLNHAGLQAQQAAVLQAQQAQQQQAAQQAQQRAALAGMNLGNMGGNMASAPSQQSLLAAALAAQQQQQQQQNSAAAARGMQQQFGQSRPPLQASPAMAAALSAAGGGREAGDPIQTLQDIGRTLAQLGITVEAAVNAGLLGGLSASDVRIVAEAHRQDMELRSGGAAAVAAGMGGANAAGAAPSPFAPGIQHQQQQAALQHQLHQQALHQQQLAAAGLSGGSASAASSLHGSFSGGAPGGAAADGTAAASMGGAASAPNPSSPTGSLGGASAASAPARPSRLVGSRTSPSSQAGDEDDVDRLLLEIEEESANGPAKKAAVDEATIHAKVQEMAKQFDAGQYGFFGARGGGSGSAGAGSVEGVLGALETADSGGAALPGDLLSAELEGRLNLGGNGSGRGTPSPGQQQAQNHALQLQQMAVAQAAAAQATGGQQQADAAGRAAADAANAANLASLWGQQGESRPGDPFGTYLAGLRLGTGF